MENGRVGEVLGVWRLVELIGSGGMGEVYRAERIDGVVAQSRAVKILRAVYDPRVADEADALRLLEHPNIARCFDAGLTPDRRRCLVLEYVDGTSITDYADQKGLSVHDRLELFMEACSAIEYAHRSVLAHLDIKPANILVDASGRVKVIDFGIARRLNSKEGVPREAVFSGCYASPEQTAGDAPGIPSDTYSLGAVLYELLCGHEPFDPRLAPGELERQIAEESPRPPSVALLQAKLKVASQGRHFRLEPDAMAQMRGGLRLSEARKLIAGDLDTVCLFALRKEPHRRYQSAEDMRSDLEKIVSGRKPPIARSGDPLYSALRSARRKPLAFCAAVAIVVIPLNSLSLVELLRIRAEAGIARQQQIDGVARSTLNELRADVRPRLATDPQLHDAVSLLDELQLAGEAEGRRSAAEELFDESIFQLRRMLGNIPKDNEVPQLR
jgi:eukaryotic-like serine/threonine-protein kinase